MELDQWALLAPGQRRQVSKGSQFSVLDRMSTDVAHCSIGVTLSHLWLHDMIYCNIHRIEVVNCKCINQLAMQ